VNRYFKVIFYGFPGQHGDEADRLPYLLGPRRIPRETERPRICTRVFKTSKAAQAFRHRLPFSAAARVVKWQGGELWHVGL
jgi:hypothetical protein